MFVSLRVISIRVWRESIEEPEKDGSEEVGSSDTEPHRIFQDCYKLPVVVSFFAKISRQKEESEKHFTRGEIKRIRIV